MFIHSVHSVHSVHCVHCVTNSINSSFNLYGRVEHLYATMVELCELDSDTNCVLGAAITDEIMVVTLQLTHRDAHVQCMIVYTALLGY